jgi:hypothetical protein
MDAPSCISSRIFSHPATQVIVWRPTYQHPCIYSSESFEIVHAESVVVVVVGIGGLYYITATLQRTYIARKIQSRHITSRALEFRAAMGNVPRSFFMAGDTIARAYILCRHTFLRLPFHVRILSVHLYVLAAVQGRAKVFTLHSGYAKASRCWSQLHEPCVWGSVQETPIRMHLRFGSGAL